MKTVFGEKDNSADGAAETWATRAGGGGEEWVEGLFRVFLNLINSEVQLRWIID